MIAIVVRTDGSISAMKPTDLREVAAREERIRQLEAEIEQMRPIVDAALNWNRTDYRNLDECEEALEAISDACDAYGEDGDGN